MNKKSPIGFFDSGLGGLSVFRSLSQLLPQEDVVYLADNKRIPYGERSPEEIIQYTSDAIHFLEKQGVKLIILACHTASAHWTRRKTSVPVMGMIESSVASIGVAPKMGGLAVFGTPSTIASGVYEYELQCKYGDLKPLFLSFSRLVPMIESNWLPKEEIENLIRREVPSIENIEQVLLACSHYPLIQESFQSVLGGKIRLADPAIQLSLNVRDFLERENLINSCGGFRHQFFVTETPDLFSKKVEHFLDTKIATDLCTI